MIPFQKIFTLIVRTFSKPVLTMMKKKQQEGRFKGFRWFFVHLGKGYHGFEQWINQKMLKTVHKKHVNQLKQEILLEKGIQAFYQLFFYSIVIGLPLNQLYKSAQSAQKKETKLKQKIQSLEGKLDQANEGLNTLISQIKITISNKQVLQKSRKAKILQQQIKIETQKEQQNIPLPIQKTNNVSIDQ